MIENADVSHLQDVLLEVFWRYVSEKVTALIAAQTDGGEDAETETSAQTSVGSELPTKLVAAGEDLLAAIAAMKEAYRKVNTKAMSAEIRKRDEERDGLLREVKALVATMARMSSMPERQVAGQVLQASMAQWKLNPKRAYLIETTAVGTWLQVVAQSAELSAAAETLGLSTMLTRLAVLNDEVTTLINDRSNAIGEKRARQQRRRRKEAEARWRTFVLVLNAAAVMDPDEHRYDHFTGPMNQQLKELKQDMRHTRRMNPRKRDGEDKTQEEG